MLKKRIYKCSYNTFKTIIQTAGSIWGYYLCKETSVWPSLLGGRNAWGPELWESKTTQPYYEFNEGFVLFSLITMGYHIE